MATLSRGVARRAPQGRRRARPSLALVQSIRTRIYLTLALVIVLTLIIAGVVFAFLVGGYQDRLAASTLRQIGRPVYESVVTLADANFRAFEVSRQLQGTVQAEPDVLIWFVDRDSTVVSEASRNPRFRGEQLELDLTDVGEGANGFVDGTVRTGDGTRLNYLAAGLPTDAADRFNAAYVVLALPTENRQTVLGDLTWRLILAGGLALAGGMVAALLLSRSIYRPWQATSQAARGVARGDFRQKVVVSGTTEARELAETFNQMTAEVQRQQAGLRDFLANVSHDLQTPLTSIYGFSQALLDGTVEETEARAGAYRIIEQESRRLLRLVEGLLDLSRIEAGQAEIRLVSVAVAPLLHHVRDLFVLRAEELQVSLEVEPPEVADVLGDVDRLEQVLTNLVDNALRHTPADGRVWLGARQESDATVSLTVSDTGTGIAPEALRQVFDRFFRSDRPGEQGGTGLGLAIARELVRAQQGEIQVESTPALGTTFRILLRAHRDGESAARRRSLS